ncbi:MAG: hypothetical protein ACJA0N_001294 [Pseudohongiellaceae bacterium]|jgi:hypothetical protein
MPSLKQVTEQFTAYIRNPNNEPAPKAIEQRRLNIYKDLFYNNIETFVSGAFPVLRTLIDDKAWHELVRDFMVAYRCQTPYFLEISQEFQRYLADRPALLESPAYPCFIQELAHYEWVELALDVSEVDLNTFESEHPLRALQDLNELLEQLPVVSPLAWSLAYQYPVHQIGESFQPEQPLESPCYLIVYRNRNDEVHFMEANAVTARLLEILQAGSVVSGREALEQLAQEMQHSQPQQIIDHGFSLLQQLLSVDIILGVNA